MKEKQLEVISITVQGLVPVRQGMNIHHRIGLTILGKDSLGRQTSAMYLLTPELAEKLPASLAQAIQSLQTSPHGEAKH